MKNLPLGIQTFRKIREEDYLYVDKTQNIYNLIAGGCRYCLLSRPRRFGKSLLVTTLKELFSGNKELFKDLWIYDKITWEKYPVIHLDFLGLESGGEERLIPFLENLVNRNAEAYGITLTQNGYGLRFRELIEHLSQIGRVVILVDEYDKPIINNIDNIEVAAGNREVLKAFYETIKGADQYVKFVFITGVSKFSKVSVFSGLNNLRDITISKKFATITGYTQAEMDHYFADRTEALAGELSMDKRELVKEIKTWYNGYSWDGVNFVYNPYSILTLFLESVIDNYWFVSGTPTFLLQLIKNHHIDVTGLDGYRTSGAIFDSFDIENMNVHSLLFQTGYLTIKEVKGTGGKRSIYSLAYPNREVKESFMEHLTGQLADRFANEIGVMTEDLKESLNAGDMDQFIRIVTSVFAGISYNMFVGEKEGYYQTVIYLLLKLVGIDIQTEVETNVGRIDAVIQTETAVYVMEFKLGPAKTALDQIKEKNYHQKYIITGKPIHLVGIGFDPKARNISDYLLETVAAV